MLAHAFSQRNRYSHKPVIALSLSYKTIIIYELIIVINDGRLMSDVIGIPIHNVLSIDNS